ncbi:unnamed protein product [Owenia fusiformis]|uniref:Uncharacterized protein n=1 Tax=Owenia fusiformis TaxID=6347 RepID=A0A8J1UJL5_OWEFU|nr:unnamed protein product [Owenia fusiformis]
MMVTAAQDPVGLRAILTSVQDKSLCSEDKVDAYLAFSERLRGDLKDFNKEVCENSVRLFNSFVRDIVSEDVELTHAAMQALGFCLHDSNIAGSMSEEMSLQVIKALCTSIVKTTDKTTCTRGLWCLSKQNLPLGILEGELHTILCAIEHALCSNHFQSITVEHEAINAVVRLLEQLPKQMKVHVTRWSKLVYPLLVHSASKVRDRALIAMEMGMAAILSHQEEISVTMVPHLKTMILGELKKLMASKHETYTMKVWIIFVKILGKKLHHGGLINQFLGIVEQAFKSASPATKCVAFKAWKQLIDTFALDTNILSDPKRLKLLMQVFKLNNAKLEEIALVKLDAWWHLVCQLGEKVSVHFDMVVAPLLSFCFGQLGADLKTPSKMSKLPGGLSTPTLQRMGSTGFGSPATPRMSLVNSPGASSSVKPFSSIQKLGAEILAQLIGGAQGDSDLPTYKSTLERLQHDVISTPAFFSRHASLFIAAARMCFTSCEDDLDESLLYHTWYALVAHVKNALELSTKNDNGSIFSYFLSTFQEIVSSTKMSKLGVLKLYEAVCCLPRPALTSPAYEVGSVMHGTPVLFLVQLILDPVAIETYLEHERFFSVFETLVNVGMSNSSTALTFAQSVLKLVEKTTSVLDNRELLWRLWSVVIHPLMEHVIKSNEVNQGDALEHNFECMYASLTLPVVHLFTADLHQASLRTIIKTWGDLYRTFARLSALVTNAEANIGTEELCARIASALPQDQLQNPMALEAVSQACHVMVDSLDFSTFSNTAFNLKTPLSPSKWSKRKSKPLGNLHSFTKLTARVIEAFNTHQQEAKGQKLVAGMQNTGNNIVSVLATLFNHLPSSTCIANILNKLASPISELYQPSNAKSYSGAFGQKLEKLWLDICSCIQGRYTSLYDSEFLAHISPLLQQTLCHPRRQIKTQAITFWSATFAKSSELDYPESLKPVLIKAKAKTSLKLPGFDSSSVATIEETQISQMSQAETQISMPHLAGIPSPHKLKGSFMNKTASPKVKKSPLKPTSNGSPASVRRKLPLSSMDDMNSRDFVVIPSSPARKRRILTEHQKEVMKEKTFVPAMYSGADVSMDGSLMGQFDLSTQTQYSQPDTPGAYESIVNPFASKRQKLDGGKEKVTERVVEKEVAPFKGLFTKPDSSYVPKLEQPKRRRSVRFSKDESNESTKDQDLIKNIIETSIDKVIKNTENVDSDNEGVNAPEPDSVQVIDNDSPQVVTITDNSQEEQNEPEDISNVVEEEQPDKNALEHTDKVEVINNTPKSKHNDSDESFHSATEEVLIEEVNESAEKAASEPPSQSLLTLPSESSKRELFKGNRGRNSPRKTSRSKVSQSPQRRQTPKKPEQKSTIDKWLVKSPRKPTEVTDSITLVEDTQDGFSPVEKVISQTENSTENVIEETPSPAKQDGGKDVDRNALEEAAKNLFADDKTIGTPTKSVESSKDLRDNEANIKSTKAKPNLEALDESSQSQMGTPTKVKLLAVKLKRLTHSEIKSYSPRKSTQESLIGSIRDEKCDKDTSEHDDFSQIKPLEENKNDTENQPDMFQSSLGFELASGLQKESPNNESKDSEKESPMMEQEEPVKQANNSVENKDEVAEELDEVDSITPGGSEPIESQQTDNDLSQSIESQNVKIDQPPIKRKRGRPKKVKKVDENTISLSSSESSQFSTDSGSTLISESKTFKRRTKKSKAVSKKEENSESTQDSVDCEKQVESESLTDSISCTLKSEVKKVKKHKANKQKIVVEIEPETPVDSETSQYGPLHEQETLECQNDPIPTKPIDADEIPENDKATGDKEGEQKDSIQVDNDITFTFSQGDQTDAQIDNNEFKNEDIKQREDSALDDSFTDSQPLSKFVAKKKAKSKKKSDNKQKAKKLQEATDVAKTKLDKLKLKTKKRKRAAKALEDSPEKIVEDSPEIVVEVQKECNLDYSSDDDLPLNSLSEKLNSSGESENVEKQERIQNEIEINVVEEDSEPKDSEIKISSEPVITDSCEDMFGESEKPIIEDLKETKEVTKNNRKGKSPKIVRSQEMEKKRLEINMTSPINKRLRSKKPLVRSASLNRSFEKLKKKQKKPRRSLFELSTKQKQNHETGDKTVKDEEIALKEEKKPEFELYDAKTLKKITKEEIDNPKDNNSEEVVLKEEKITETKPEEPFVNDTSGQSKIFSSPQKSEEPEMPETPTSANRHQSRGAIMLERAIKLGLKQQAVKTSPTTTRVTMMRPSFKRPIIKVAKHSRANDRASPVTSANTSPSFHPIEVRRIYSPSASPSAGILKKRRFTDGPIGSDSPSPPNKQRRVSFGEPQIFGEESRSVDRGSPRPVNRCLELPRQSQLKSQFNPSPLVTTTPSKVVASSSEKFITTPSKQTSKCNTSPSDSDKTSFAVPSSLTKRKQEAISQSPSSSGPTQGTYQITQESQLDNTKPVHPPLVTCVDSLDSIIPQLTSSMWVRGLESLLKARNIVTIGQLCSLTEYEVQQLPIRSPKVATLRKALTTYKVINKTAMASLEDATSILEDAMATPTLDDATSTLEDAQPILEDAQPTLEDATPTLENATPTLEDATLNSEVTTPTKAPCSDLKDLNATSTPMKADSPVKGSSQGPEDENMQTDIEELLETSGEFLDEVNKLSQSIQEDADQSNPSAESCDKTDQLNIDVEAGNSTPDNLMMMLRELSEKLTPEQCRRLPSADIFQAHSYLNVMMSSVMTALKSKCHSPK